MNYSLSLKNLEEYKKISYISSENMYSILKEYADQNITVRRVYIANNMIKTIFFLKDNFTDDIRKIEKFLQILINIDQQAIKLKYYKFTAHNHAHYPSGYEKEGLSFEEYNKRHNVFPVLFNSDEVSLGYATKIYQYKHNCFTNIIVKLGYDKASAFFTKMYDRNEVLLSDISFENSNDPKYDNLFDLHDFNNALPSRINPKNENSQKFIDELFEFLMKVIEWNRSEFIKVLSFINYYHVRCGNNKDEILRYIEIVNAAKGGFNNGGNDNVEKIINYHMLFKYGKDNFNDYRERVIFSKIPADVNTIGQKTACCFKPGGLAKSLLKPAIMSPISGIIYGSYENRQVWFCFVWEIVEYNSETHEYEMNLVLDNLEANKTLRREDFKDLIKYLEENTTYRKIYLGDSRNDIASGFKQDIPGGSTTYKRPYTLINYEKNFASYGYDDSTHLLTVVDRKTHNNKVILSRMDYSDLHRAQYVERIVWDKDSDKDFKTIDLKAPSYFIHNENCIFGYVANRLLKMRKSDKKIYFDIKDYRAEKRELEDKFNPDDYEDILYFDDIFLIADPTVKSTIQYITEDLIKFVKENNIKYYSASFNHFSKKFKEVIDQHLKFVKDNRISSPYTESNEHIRKLRTPPEYLKDPELVIEL